MSTTLGFFYWDTWKMKVRISTSVNLISLTAIHATRAHYIVDHPLATGFSIKAGKVKVTMAHDIPPRDDYFLVRKCGFISCSKESQS